MPAASASDAVLDAADEHAGPVGQADRAPQPPGDVARGDGDAERGRSTATRRGRAQSTRARASSSAGMREVEALADPVGVEPDERARRRRRARRPTSRARAAPCARRCPRCAGRRGRGTRARRPRRARTSRAAPPLTVAATPKTGEPIASAPPSPQAIGVAPAVSTVDDREVAVAVDAGDRAAASSGRRRTDGDLARRAGCGRWSGPGRRR